jgi:hypothetical protein
LKSLPSRISVLVFAVSIGACSGKSDSPKAPASQEGNAGTPAPADVSASGTATGLTPAISPATGAPATAIPAPAASTIIPEAPAPTVIPTTDAPESLPPLVETPPTETPAVEPVLPPAPAPAPAPQIARFITWIDLIEKDLLVADPATVPDRLYKNKAREKVFNIQALGRIYKGVDPGFKKLHEHFRDLEDAIGDYQKWADYEEQGIADGATEIVLAKLKTNREAGRVRLVNTLRDSNFLPSAEGDVPYTVELRQFLMNYSWPSPKEDKKFVVTQMVDELQKIKTAVYDFSHLEDGNGVHEYRRKLRWFSMESRGLNGLITLKPKDTKCPVESWSYLVNDGIATTKYAVLPPSLTEPDPISLTPCLYIKVARLVEDVNGIKTKFESAGTMSETETTDLIAEPDRLVVEAWYNDMMANDLIGRLQMELIWGLIEQDR